MKALLYFYLPLIYASLVGLFCVVMYAIREQVSFRRLCFGWICRRRGHHEALAPYSVWTYMLTSGVVARYRCLCGEQNWKWVNKGEQVPKPLEWRVGQ